MEDRLKELMQELGNAINESLSDSDRIAAAIGEIKRAGYDVFLVLEATIGFNKREDSDEAELCNRAGYQFRDSLGGQGAHPSRNSVVEFMLEETKRDEGIHVKQVLHGNSARISRTCLLLKTGDSDPALRTGRPVIRSTRMLTCEKRVLRGANTTRPAGTVASSESPG